MTSENVVEPRRASSSLVEPGELGGSLPPRRAHAIVREARGAMLAPSPTPFSSEPPCVVIDNGSGRIKVGWSGAEAPKAVLPTSGLEGVSDDRRPLAHGIIADWDAMESYWDHAFTNLLDIDTEQVNVLIAANMFETKDNRERIVHTLFETFAAPNVYLASAPVRAAAG